MIRFEFVAMGRGILDENISLRQLTILAATERMGLLAQMAASAAFDEGYEKGFAEGYLEGQANWLNDLRKIFAGDLSELWKDMKNMLPDMPDIPDWFDEFMKELMELYGAARKVAVSWIKWALGGAAVYVGFKLASSK